MPLSQPRLVSTIEPVITESTLKITPLSEPPFYVEVVYSKLHYFMSSLALFSCLVSRLKMICSYAQYVQCMFADCHYISPMCIVLYLLCICMVSDCHSATTNSAVGRSDVPDSRWSDVLLSAGQSGRCPAGPGHSSSE